MEYVLNELSLCGQYENGDQFATRGMTPLLGVLSTLSSFGVNDILKKSSIFDADVAKGLKLYELTNARMSPAVLAVCSHLSRMQREPFWDLQTVQEEGKCYYLQRKVDEDTIEEEDVSRTGVAEAYARKGCLISFCEDGYEENTEIIRQRRPSQTCMTKRKQNNSYLNRETLTTKVTLEIVMARNLCMMSCLIIMD